MTSENDSWSLLARNFADADNIDDLDTDSQVLINFLILINDIKYRKKYGNSFTDTQLKDYSKGRGKQVLADRVSPVDKRLPGQ